ncbi:MAG TPA: permease-like cell division protein FtsX [Candidatus Kapabacteria bacterium]|nr:permease-like cell division protein FtsX [Candidatus Kapabacteria bacterium]
MLIVREALAAIRRTPLLSALTALVIAISLAVIAFFILLSLRATQTLDEYRSRLPVEAYFDPSISSESAKDLSHDIIMSLGDVSTSKFISKEDALKEFTFSSGEDLVGVVGSNPLPAGVRMTFVKLSSIRAAEIIRVLHSSKGITDILFDGKTLLSLENRRKTLFTLTYLVGGFLLLVSVALAASLARLAMLARRETIRAMSLLGAKRQTIVIPYYIEAFTAGSIGGLISAASVILLHEFAIPKVAPELVISTYTSNEMILFIAGNVILGGLLGLVGSMFSTLRIRTV